MALFSKIIRRFSAQPGNRDGHGGGRLAGQNTNVTNPRNIFRETLPTIFLAIDALYDSADACPVLKSAVGGIRTILKTYLVSAYYLVIINNDSMFIICH